MVKNTLSFCLLACCCTFLHASPVIANHKRLDRLQWNPVTMAGAVTDTLPATEKKPPENDPKKEDPIKAVPKSRKQDKPVAVTPVVVKPVVIKPTVIVKPIIKIH